jgi:hypothetical protein
MNKKVQQKMKMYDQMILIAVLLFILVVLCASFVYGAGIAGYDEFGFSKMRESSSSDVTDVRYFLHPPAVIDVTEEYDWEIECVDHSDCDFGQYCHSELGYCVFQTIMSHRVIERLDRTHSCTDHGDCNPDEYCNLKLGVCLTHRNKSSTRFDYTEGWGSCSSNEDCSTPGVGEGYAGEPTGYGYLWCWTYTCQTKTLIYGDRCSDTDPCSHHMSICLEGNCVQPYKEVLNTVTGDVHLSSMGLPNEGLTCSSDDDCVSPPDGMICVDDKCVIRDVDGDGYYLGNKEPLDCDDASALCSEECVNSDPIVGINIDGMNDEDIWDCKDWCIDKDGDTFCDASSARLLPEDFEYGNLDEILLADAGWTTYPEDVEDPAYLGEIEALFIELNILGQVHPAYEIVFNLDCDDNNRTRDLHFVEDESCNYFDDDCDGEVDECSDIAGKGRVCVYTLDTPRCQVLDNDGDTYMGVEFNCPSCIDCDDNDADVHPYAVDCKDGDNCNDEDENCNGFDDEWLNTDFVSDENNDMPDEWDECDDEGPAEGYPVDYNGCRHSTDDNDDGDSRDNLPGWSV